MQYELPRVLTVAQAARLGLTAARCRTELRRGNWRRLGPGLILTRPESPSRHDLITLGLSIGGVGSALSGWDAARLYGLGPDRPLVPHVLVLAAAGQNRTVRGVRVRRTARPYEWRYVTADGEPLRVAQPARAVADTALCCDRLATARALCTDAVQRSLCTVDELAHQYESGPRNGSYFLRRAVLDVISGARSVAEAEAADALRAGNIPPFEMNVPLGDLGGPRGYVADFVWRRLRAVLEIDSRRHHFLERDWLATMRRHNELSAARFAVTHWAPAVVRTDPVGFAAQVSGWLAGRAEELGVTLFP